MMLYWGIFTIGFYLGIIFFLALSKEEEEDLEGNPQDLQSKLKFQL